MSEWLKETGCKPVGSAYVGSNPTPTTLIELELQPGEKELWRGTPSSDRLLMRNDYALIPSGFVLGIVGFVGFFVSLKHVTGGDGGWPLVVLSAVAMWAAWELVFGHLIRRRRRAQATGYLLTDRRLITERRFGGDRSAYSVVNFSDRPRIRVFKQYEGRATIEVEALILFNIEGAARVESLIRQQLPTDIR